MECWVCNAEVKDDSCSGSNLIEYYCSDDLQSIKSTTITPGSNQNSQIVTETKTGTLTEFSYEGNTKKREQYIIGLTEKCKDGAIALDKTAQDEIATEFPIDAWGFTGWGECKDQQGTLDQLNDYCNSKAHGGVADQ